MSNPFATGDREQTASAGEGALTHVHAVAALMPLIVHNARDLIAILDTAGRRIYNSPSYAPLLGGPEELVGTDSFEDIHPEDRERVREIFRDTVRTGAGQRAEYRLMARDGTVRVIQTEGGTIRDDADRVAGVVVVGRDVTEERRSAGQLDMALRRQKALAEFTLFALREPEKTRVIERATALVAEALNVDFGTALELEPDGKAFRVVAAHNWPPDRLGKRIGAGPDTQAGHALELYRRSGTKTLEAPQPVAIEDLRADWRFAHTFRVRELGVISAVCVVIPAAERPFGMLTAHSRTRRRFEPVEIEFMQAVANVLSAALARYTAHADVQESEARFRSLAALSADWYWEQDSELRFRFISEPFFRKSGMLREEVLGKRRWELFGASPPGGSWDAHRAALEARQPFRDFEFARVGADGTEHYQTISGEPVFDAEGRFTGYRGTARDITERHRADQELRARAEGDRALIDLGLLALREQDAGALLDTAVRIVARALGVELAKVLELLPDGSGLKLVAGTGWKPGTVGDAIVGAGIDSQAGYTIREYEQSIRGGNESFAPVIVPDLRTERRFRGPALLTEHSVVSGMSVVIPGATRPWGVLGVHSRVPRHFEQREAEFLQAAANLLSAALERCRSHAALQESEDRYRDLVEHSEDLICTHQLDGRIGSINPWAAKVLGYEPAELLNMNVRDVLAPKWRPEFDDYIDRIKKDGVASGLMVVQTRTGEKRLWKYANSLRTEGVPVPIVRGMAHDVSEQMRAEAALRKSEELLRATFDHAPSGILLYDASGCFIKANRALQTMLGYSENELRQMTLADLVHPEERSESRRLREDLIAGKRTRIVSNRRYLRKDGGSLSARITVSAVRGGDGSVLYTIALIEDVTEQLRAEAKLREMRENLAASEARLRAFMDHSPVSMFIKDREGRYRHVNAQFLRNFGLTADRVLGRTTAEIFPREQAEAFLNHDARVRAARAPIMDEAPALFIDGVHATLANKFPILDDTGEIVAIGGVVADITDRNRMEQALRENRRLLARAQEIAGLGYWEYDLAAGVARASRELRRMLGIPMDLPPQNLEWSLNMIHPDDRERVRAILTRSIEQGTSYEYETRVTTLGGAERIILGSGEAVKDDAGRMAKLIGTCLDITEQRRREQELCDAAEELQGLSRRLVEAEETERRRIAAELHDRVGQNLTALSINLHILSNRMTGLDDDARRRLRDSLGLLDATALCIEGVLDDLRPPMLDDWGLGPTFRWVGDEFSRRTEIPVRVQVLGRERRIDSPTEIALLRIVQEALNNVSKHASAGQVEITLGWEPEAVRVEVTDNGLGFEHSESRRESGLGILTMRERVQAANGRLNIDSAPGKGTRVRALIPR
ncbi:MAG: PAS domain S-box protein [Burkholderiales bacterium]|nr:PAS domain S-box protein [Burkholderiales bacterium]